MVLFDRRIFLPLLATLYCSMGWAATDIVPTEILVKYRAQGFAATAGHAIGHGVTVLRLADGQFADTRAGDRWGWLNRKLSELRADPAVEYAEPNYHGEFADMPPAVATPNDPGYASQWWLDKVGARQGWAVATGKGVTVAVLDSGVDLNHPDLQANLRADGYNFGDGNANPQDVYGHGTFVAGIVAASRDNTTAGCGLAPQAHILPIKINVAATSTFSSSTLTQAIDYAVARGVQIINLSISVDSETQTVGAAIQRALDAGVVVVAAAGNQGGSVTFPGTYPGVITVAGTNQDDTLWAISNRGTEVALAAPATGVYSTLLGGGFGLRGEGTSYSTPMVAAAVADLLQVDSRLDRDHLVTLLKASTRPIATAGQSFGVLDAGQSLLSLLPDLMPDKRSYANSDSLRLEYRLPLTAGPVDIYVALTTPSGEFSLGPDGGWYSASSGYQVIGKGYHALAAVNGTLFGNNGAFASIWLAGVPAGRYTWRAVLVNTVNGELLGPIIESAVTVN